MERASERAAASTRAATTSAPAPTGKFPDRFENAGTMRRIRVSNMDVVGASNRDGIIISGIPDHLIEDVKLSRIRISYRGEGTRKAATARPPEAETLYPEPSIFGEIPSYSLFARHVSGLELDDVSVGYEKQDLRPPFVLEDVRGARFSKIQAQHAPGVPTFRMQRVESLRISGCEGLADLTRANVDHDDY
jgi:hypothetical protein